MIGRLVLAAFRMRPGRSALLLFGYGLGVGVTIALLSIGGALLVQSRDRALIGGGDLVVLPEGLDLETFRTGGVSSLYFRIERASFLLREVLGGRGGREGIAAAAPWIENEVVYVRTPGEDWVAASADGELPSASAALDASRRLVSGTWTDTDRDAAFLSPSDSALYASLDGFHMPSVSDSAWAEWHYFNVVLPDGWLYLTYMVAGDIPGGRWGGRMLATRVRETGETVFEDTIPAEDVAFRPGSPDIEIAGSAVRIRPDGTYAVRARIPAADGGPALDVDLSIGAARPKYVPPVDVGGGRIPSGYVVPLLDGRATGRICRAAACLRLEGAPAYHDHNWGVWRDVTWEWGQVNAAGGLSILYGSVSQGGEPTGTPFAYLFDDAGFAGVLPIRELEWTWDAEGRRPAALHLVAARGADTLRVEGRVEHARATRTGEGDGGATFFQMRATVFVEFRLAGERAEASGSGFLETWRRE